MIKSKLKFLPIALFSLGLISCGNDDSAVQTGRFIDSSVSGLTYQTGSLSGITNELGEFTYRIGETVIFSIGDVELPPVTITVEDQVVTPLTVFETEEVTHTGVVNTLRLLQSLDDDNDPSNGINISQDVIEQITLADIDLESETFDQDVQGVLADTQVVLVSEEQAVEHFKETLLEEEIVPEPILVEQVTIEANFSLLTGETKTVSLDISPNFADDKTIVWQSSDDQVAMVDADGIVTAISVGETTITATNTASEQFDSLVVNVETPFVDITAISLGDAVSLLLGGSQQLTADIAPENATQSSVVWSSSNEAVASVDANGLVTTNTIGTATITATNDTSDVSGSVNVVVSPIFVTQISLGENAILSVTDALQLAPTILPNNATDTSLIWSSSNDNSVTVTPSGLVNAVSPGSAMITALNETSGISSSMTVTVNDVLVTSVDLGVDFSLDVAATQQVASAVLPANATNKNLTWSTNNASVAIVNNGVVTAISPGSALITAVNAASDRADTVTVMVNDIIATDISLGDDITLEVAGTQQLSATFTPLDTTNKAITWVSSSPENVTVSVSGVITGVSPGSSTITVTNAASNMSDTLTVTVSDIIATSINLGNTVELATDSTRQLSVMFTPEKTTDKSVTWLSNDTNIATVSDAGLVTAVAEGDAIITVINAASGVEGSVAVSVLDGIVLLTSIALGDDLTLDVTDIETLTATLLPNNATDQLLAWSSSDDTVVTVSMTGAITAVAPGSATITATNTASGMSDDVVVNVNDIMITSIALGDAIALNNAETQQVTAVVLPNDATDQTLAWSSDNTSVATVSIDGLITAVGKGSAVISAANIASGKSATVDVTVSQLVTSVVLEDDIDVVISEIYQLDSTVLPANANDMSLTWVSSDPSIATVDASGVVTAMTIGTATITATNTVSNESDTLLVNVIYPALSVDITSIVDNEIIDTDAELTVTATTTGDNTTSATLWVNGSAIDTIGIADAPFTWSSTSIAALDDLTVGEHTIEVRAVDADENVIDTVTIRIDESIELFVLADNIGGGEYTAQDGSLFTGEKYLFSSSWSGSDSDAVAGTEDDYLFQSYHSHWVQWLVPSTDIRTGTYSVDIYFNEYKNDQVIGARVSKITTTNLTLEDNFDIMEQAGGVNTALIKTFDITTNVDGDLVVNNNSDVGQSIMSAVKVTKFVSSWDDEDEDGVVNYLDSCPISTVADVVFIDGTGDGCVPNFNVDINIVDDTLYEQADEIAVAPIVTEILDANIVSADLKINGSVVSSLTAAPYTWSSNDISALADIASGVNTLTVDFYGYDENKLSSDSVTIRRDGDFYTVVEAYKWDWTNVDPGGHNISDYTSALTGITFTHINGGWDNKVEPQDVLGTEEDGIYYGTFNTPGAGGVFGGVAGADETISFAVDNDTYQVEMHFAETYWTYVNARVFDVTVEGNLIIDDLDVFSTAGAFTAYVETHSDITVADGSLDFVLTGSVEKPLLNAIVIKRLVGQAFDDEDNDGVLNLDDACLGTAANTTVDEDGCYPELIVNGDFETGVATPFTHYYDNVGGASSIEVTAAAAKDGGFGIRYTSNGLKHSGISLPKESTPQIFGEGAGRKFLLTYDIKINSHNNGGSGRAIYLAGIPHVWDDDEFFTKWHQSADNSEWASMSVEFDETTWSTLGRLDFYKVKTVEGDTVDVYIDNISIKQID